MRHWDILWSVSTLTMALMNVILIDTSHGSGIRARAESTEDSLIHVQTVEMEEDKDLWDRFLNDFPNSMNFDTCILGSESGIVGEMNDSFPRCDLMNQAQTCQQYVSSSLSLESCLLTTIVSQDIKLDYKFESLAEKCYTIEKVTRSAFTYGTSSKDVTDLVSTQRPNRYVCKGEIVTIQNDEFLEENMCNINNLKVYLDVVPQMPVIPGDKCFVDGTVEVIFPNEGPAFSPMTPSPTIPSPPTTSPPTPSPPTPSPPTPSPTTNPTPAPSSPPIMPPSTTTPPPTASCITQVSSFDKFDKKQTI